MASLFNVLGSLGENYGRAKQEVSDDAIRNRMLTAQLAEMRNRDMATRQEIELRKQQMTNVGWDKAVTFIGDGGKRYQYNPVTSKIRPYQLPEGAIEEGTPDYTLASIEKGLGRKLTQQERDTLVPIMQVPGYAQFLKTTEPDYSTHYVGKNEKGIPTEYAYDPKHPEKGKLAIGPAYERPVFAPGSEPQLPEARIKALADMWHRDAKLVPPAKYKAQVEEYMENHDMRPAINLSNLEKLNVRLIKQIQPKIDTALKLLEGDPSNQDPRYQKSVTDSDNWLFGANSVAARRLQMGKYNAGHTPSSDKRISDIIRAAAALKVMGVAPWTSLGRGKYMYQDISVHLPDPHDTPKQLYEKLLFLKQVMDEAQDALPEGAMDYGVQPSSSGMGNSALDQIDAIIKNGNSSPKP